MKWCRCEQQTGDRTHETRTRETTAEGIYQTRRAGFPFGTLCVKVQNGSSARIKQNKHEQDFANEPQVTVETRCTRSHLVVKFSFSESAIDTVICQLISPDTGVCKYRNKHVF